jgi:N-methylhydantoinase B
VNSALGLKPEGVTQCPPRSSSATAKPFKKVKVDSVTIDIIESALRNARFEMDTVLFRTAMSPGIREQHDEFPMIANLEGKMVVGQFGSFIWGFMQGYDGTIEEGDIFWTTDPYSVNGAISHANDWLMLMPIYKDGRIIAWSAMFGHMTDIGGKVPGSLPTDARQIYEEGIVVPPVKIFQGGKLQEDVLASCCTTAACRCGTCPTSTRSSRRCAPPAIAASRSRSASATTCSTARWTRCSSATSARCAS